MTRRLLAPLAAVVLACTAPGIESVLSADALVGIALALCAAAAIRIDPRSHIGDLVAIAGVVWFAGNFASAEYGVVADIGLRLLFLHRAVLAHAAITFPASRPRRWTWPLLIGLYACSVMPAVMRSSEGALVWGVALVVAAMVDSGQRRASSRVARGWAIGAATMFATGVVLMVPLHVYQTLVVFVAAQLVVGLFILMRRRSHLTDAVVELIHGPERAVRAGFVRALGDRNVEVVFAEGDGWVDELARPASFPIATSGRHVSRIDVDEVPIAAIMHDSDVAQDPVMVRSLADAVRLAADNVGLRAAVRREADEVIASRARVSVEAYRVRQQLADAIRVGPDRQLTVLDVELRDVGAPAAAAIAQLALLRQQIDALIDGLGPLAATGGALGPALCALATRSPVVVDLEVTADAESHVAETLWFVCAEALANVAKHSGADVVQVRLSRGPDGLVLEVNDNGRGGASMQAGAGLLGLSDRVAAAGGRLSVDSDASGTRLTAVIPDDAA